MGAANVNATVGTNAEGLLEWVREWFNLISYGPTYQRMSWNVKPSSTETTRFQFNSTMTVTVHWGDPSVSWEQYADGKWEIDISEAAEVTLYFKSDVGEYGQQHSVRGRPSEIASVHLLPYLEIACDDEIPFLIKDQPIAKMFWRPGINIEHIVKPN